MQVDMQLNSYHDSLMQVCWELAFNDSELTLRSTRWLCRYTPLAPKRPSLFVFLVCLLFYLLYVEVQLYVNKPTMGSGSGYPVNGSITVSEVLGILGYPHMHIVYTQIQHSVLVFISKYLGFII